MGKRNKEDEPEYNEPQVAIKKKKGTVSEPSSMKNGKEIEGNTKKTDWVKLKEKKKQLKTERKKKKSLFEVGVKSKQIWEKLRKRDCTKFEKNELITELHELLKGNYAKAVLSHDVGRVVQWLLKLGSPEIRTEISKELENSYVEMCQSKYGSFCIKQMLKRGSKVIKDSIIKSFMGNVVKLMSHRVASPIISGVYSAQANSLHRCHMRQEFFGDIYRVMKNDDAQNLKFVLENMNEMRDSVLASTKANLLKVISKELVESKLLNSVLAEFLSLCSDADRSEIITAIHELIPLMAKTKEGAKVGMMCVWHGTQKDRKVIMKSLKTSVAEVAVCEHGNLILLSIFDSVDDTVLVKKVILSEVTSNIVEIAKDKFGRRVILYLVAPRNPAYFHPAVIDMLKMGDGNVHSKKSTEIRRQELLNAVSEPFLEAVANDIPQWFSENSLGMVALAILTKAEKGPSLEKAFNELTNYLCNDEPVEEKEEKTSVTPIENAGLHFILKKLIHFDKKRDKENDILFSEIFLNSLNPVTMMKLISSNRGCFLLIVLLESGIEKVVEKLKGQLRGKIVKELHKQTSKGSELLIKKLTEK